MSIDKSMSMLNNGCYTDNIMAVSCCGCHIDSQRAMTDSRHYTDHQMTRSVNGGQQLD